MGLRVDPRPVGAPRLTRVPGRALALLVIVAVVSGGCGSSPPTVALRAVDAWTRPLPPSSVEASIYLTVENRGDVADRLVGGQSTRCMALTLHRTSVGADGTSTMEEASPDDATIVPGGRLDLVPNGLHLMCSGLAEPLREGDTFEVMLGFASGSTVAVEVAVEDR